MMDLPDVTIDDQNKIHILNSDVRERSTSLVEECQLLVSSTCIDHSLLTLCRPPTDITFCQVHA